MMRVDREAQNELKWRARLAREGGIGRWDSTQNGAYDPENKLKMAWIATHNRRQARNAKRRARLNLFAKDT
jgi:hypothetical protein